MSVDWKEKTGKINEKDKKQMLNQIALKEAY